MRNLCGILPLLVGVLLSSRAHGGEVTITAVDAATSHALPCRVHLKNEAGKAVTAPGLPFFHDHFVCEGKVTLSLPKGSYSLEIERGPEWSAIKSTIAVDDAPLARQFEIQRLVDMASEGWWSGDLHVHRPVADVPLLLEADDLHIAPVITWWNRRNEWLEKELPERPLVQVGRDRFYHLLAGEDERKGGALLFFNLRRPLSIATTNREFPSPLEFVAQARAQGGVWIDVEKPFWWDVPLWLASGQVDSIGLANNHMQREKMYEGEAWGRPRDAARLPPPRGNGFWTQEIYYHLLNCGLRIPPSAGSASGVLHNPVGYNRAYVYVDEGPFSYEKWWEGLRAGRVVVTNGPLLRPLVAGQRPGHVFKSAAGEELKLDWELKLDSRDKIKYIEVVQNGEVTVKVAFDDWAKTGSLPPLRFKESGWFLIRAIADVDKTFRFASTGPYYVEIGDAPRRISAASARFFQDWVAERAGRVKLDDPRQRQEVLKYHEQGRRFWEDVVSKANAP